MSEQDNSTVGTIDNPDGTDRPEARDTTTASAVEAPSVADPTTADDAVGQDEPAGQLAAGHEAEAENGAGDESVGDGAENGAGDESRADNGAGDEAAGDEAAGDEADTAEPESGDAQDARSPSKRVNQLEREGEVAADFLETLLDIADLDGDLDVDVDGDRAAVAIVDSDEGRVPRRLIGSNGEVLEALQELTRLAVQSATGERSRLMLDVGGHRAARRETLVARAQQAVDSVRSTGDREQLEAMTAFERKVVHDAVLAAGLSSESEGTEPNRCVVVLPG